MINKTEEKFIAIVDSLWHPNKTIRDALKEKGLYVYDMRTWDEGCGNTIEPRVVVNYEGSVVTNFEITSWDCDDEYGKAIDDMYDWVEKNNVVQRDFDEELEKLIQDIINKIGD